MAIDNFRYYCPLAIDNFRYYCPLTIDHFRYYCPLAIDHFRYYCQLPAITTRRHFDNRGNFIYDCTFRYYDRYAISVG